MISAFTDVICGILAFTEVICGICRPGSGPPMLFLGLAVVGVVVIVMNHFQLQNYVTVLNKYGLVLLMVRF